MKNDHFLPTLTWLRGIAAFLVVVSHAVRSVEGPWTARTEGFVEFFTGQTIWYARLFDLGSFGVCLFFCLSGFTLYVSNRRSMRDWSDLPGFYIKRVMRIWPAFMVSLLIYTLFAVFLWSHFRQGEDPVWIQGDFQLPESPGDALKYIFLTFDLTGPAGLFVGPYWSLPIEFHYYLLMAPVVVLMAALGSQRFLLPVAVGAVLVLLGRNEVLPLTDQTLLNMALSFFLGVALAELHEQQRLPTVPRWLVAPLLLVAFGIVSGLWQGFLPVWMNDPAYILLPPLVILGFLNIRAPEKDNRFTRLLMNYGTYSYSVYLFHMLAYGLIALAANRLALELNEHWFWPVFLTAAVSSYFMAALSYRWVEVPSIDFGRRADKWLSARKTTACA